MYTVILVIHLILAISIIGLVLLQRSAGGGFVGGSGGMGDFASARGTANALTRATTWAAILFFCTSLTLAYLIKHNAQAEAGALAKAVEAAAVPAVQGTPAAPAPADAPVAPAAPTAPLNKE